MRQILCYPGSKKRLAPWIIQHFPPHQLYAEPFGGSAAVLLEKPPSTIEIYNDINQEVATFFKVLAEQPERLLPAIDATPYARVARNGDDCPSSDAIEIARRYFQRNTTSWGDGSFRSQHRPQERTIVDVFEERKAACHLAAARLKRVVFEQKEALAFIKKYDGPDVLFYCDPPYYGERKRNFYEHEMMDEASHRQLSEVLHGTQAAVVLSGYPGPLYSELYGDWNIAVGHAQTDGKATRQECLWIKPRASAEGTPKIISVRPRKPIVDAVRRVIKEAANSPLNGKIAPEGRPRKLRTVRSCFTQEQRAAAVGISRRSQQHLDKIARTRPELLEQIAKGKLSIRGALEEL